MIKTYLIGLKVIYEREKIQRGKNSSAETDYFLIDMKRIDSKRHSAPSMQAQCTVKY